MTRNELTMLQSLPLDVKVAKTKLRIHDAVDRFGVDGLYISFSGGKDSTVLRELVKELYPNIPAVFCDTGLEYPELKQFANKLADETIRPDMGFVDVIKEYGYPIIGKEVAKRVYYTRRGSNWAIQSLDGLSPLGDHSNFMQRFKKYKKLVDTDFNISHICCEKMKKHPLKRYAKETGRIPFIGMMAGESSQRQENYLKTGCNSFESATPHSIPLGFWREQDILRYIKINKMEIASVYGEIAEDNELDNQIGFYEDKQSKLHTTGCDRTGCVFCAFGAHLEKEGQHRFIRLKETHPKLYKYCIDGGKYNEEGKWVPDKGLGMGHVLDIIGVKYK